MSHYAPLVRMCVLVSGRPDEAEDLVQDAFLKAADAIAGLPDQAVRSYLRTTVINLWRNRLRRASLERMALPDPISAEGIPFEDRDRVWKAVRGLPASQRACLVLRYYEDLSERETAHVLGRSVGTVKSQTSRALRRLERELG